MRSFAALVVLTAILLVGVACERPSPVTPEDPLAPDVGESWIGIAMYEGLGRDTDGIATPPVIVSAAMPASPAEGLLLPGDQLLSVNGKNVRKSVDVQATIAALPPGTETVIVVKRDIEADPEKDPRYEERSVSLRTAAKPPFGTYLNSLYVGKAFPSLGSRISVARTDANSGIVAGSQCTMEGRVSCPPFGTPGKTTLAIGKATVVAFWSPQRSFYPQDDFSFSSFKRWSDMYRARGLEIVAVAPYSPYSVGKYFADAEDYPSMAVLAIDSSALDARLYPLASQLPNFVVLDKDGVVTAACSGKDDKDLKPCEDAVVRLLAPGSP